MSALFAKKSFVYLLRTLLGLLVLAILTVLLLGTESALRWSAGQAERWSGGRLILTDVRGSLYGQVRIAALSYQDGDYRYEAKQTLLDWSPQSLLVQPVKINKLAVQELRITELKPGVEATPLPVSLRLPVTFSAPSLTVARLVFKRGNAEQVLNGIEFALDKDAARYRMRLNKIVSAWGSVQGEMTLADTRPYAVQARFVLQSDERQQAYRIAADVGGTLSQLMLDGKATAWGGKADIHAKLLPLARVPLVEARIEAARMNPASLRPDLPQAELSAVFVLKPQRAQGWQGSVALKNGRPGSWDKARLPLRELTMQFDGTPDRLKLHDLRLDMAEAGHFAGKGQLNDLHLQLDLVSSDFNPHGVHGKMRALRLAGSIHLDAQPDSQQLVGDLRYRRFQLHLDARHQDNIVELREATVRSAGSMLTAHGTLAGLDKFVLAGEMRQFNPADFGDFPAASVNATLSADGHLASAPQALLAFVIRDSQYRHQPLSGQGKLNVSKQRVWDSNIQLRLAGNHLEATGALGNPGDRFTFQIEADQLNLLGAELDGKLHANGVLEGRLAAPAGSFAAQLDGLAWGKDYRVSSLQLEGQLAQGAHGALALDASLQGLTTPQIRLDHASLEARGTRAHHTLKIRVKSPVLDAEGVLAGGWQGLGQLWSGQLEKLVNQGPHELLLESPAKVQLGRQRIVLGEARFAFAGAKFVLHGLDYSAGQISSRGEFQTFPLAYWQGLTAQDNGISSDLTLAGDWQFVARDKVNGHLAIRRERGDVTVDRDAQIFLGISQLSMSIAAVNNRLEAHLQAEGSHLGSLRADAQSTLSRHDGRWGIAGAAPLHASVDLAVGMLSWAQPLLDGSGALTLDGALKAHVRADGTFARPDLSGELSGTRLRVAMPEQGVHLTDGHFKANLQAQVLHLNELVMHGGAGRLQGNGTLDFGAKQPVMQLSLKAEQLEVLSRPDRYLVLSGSAEATVLGKNAKLLAKLKADQGMIEMPEGDAPTASRDVVVLGQLESARKRASPYSLVTDLDFDLGDNFRVKGLGLDAQLAGALKLHKVDRALPTADGSIRVVTGVFAAYGQRLEIERGIVNFQGALDNPGLNIVAMRKNLPVEAGVVVTGTVQSPHVTLTSNPLVPDSEKLSWLALGHGLDDASGAEFSALQAAAGALLDTGKSVSLQQTIAHAAGLEDVGLKGAGGVENTVLALGKRLSSRAYLSYEQGLAGASSLIKINYTLSKRLSVKAQAGNTPAIDLFYTFSFH